MRYAGDGTASSRRLLPSSQSIAGSCWCCGDRRNGVAAPKAIVPGGYTVTLFKKDNAAAQDCTLSLADQRDWGGCVDVSVLLLLPLRPRRRLRR